jgi:hypothetical protein
MELVEDGIEAIRKEYFLLLQFPEEHIVVGVLLNVGALEGGIVLKSVLVQVQLYNSVIQAYVVSGI